MPHSLRNQHQDNRGAQMSCLPSPYNFVPLNDKVYRPSWGFQVSHDLPFEKGVSGVIEYTLTARTPILVAGEKAAQNNNTAHFHQIAGKYSIPGSTIRGLLRSVIEIITWGKMANLDDQRPSLRDISGTRVAAAYTSKLASVKAGILREKNGKMYLHSCEFVKLAHSLIEKTIDWDNRSKVWIFSAGRKSSIGDKYEIFNNSISKKLGGQRWDQIQFNFSAEHTTGCETGQVTQLGEGANNGILVLTTQINDRSRDKGKASDFIFFAEQPDGKEVSQKDWAAFLSAHDDTVNHNDTVSKARPWPGYWKKHFESARWMPVFYIEERGHYRLGLSRMPRLAADRSTYECIDLSGNGQHRLKAGSKKQTSGRVGYDFAELLFGTLGQTQDFSLKGRVFCEGAILEGKAQLASEVDVILSTPKPSFFPAYLQQNTQSDGYRLPSGQPYQTWLTFNDKEARLRGRKRYPVRPVVAAQLPDNLVNKAKIQTKLAPLKEGSRFHGRIVFHNLKQVELGALLWALTWGEDAKLLHSIGMGKPYGFGATALNLDYEQSILELNLDPGQTKVLTKEQSKAYMNSFIKHMNSFLSHISYPQNWENSDPLIQLKAMADPENSKLWGSDLRYPDLGKKEFQTAKKLGLVLAPYFPLQNIK